MGCFTAKCSMRGVIDIADELGMNRSTIHRYVVTLVELGYLERSTVHKYRLGLCVTDLGMSALNSTHLREHSYPYLAELRQSTRYTANLSVLYGSEILYITRARSFRSRQSKIDLDLHPDSRLPTYCTSMGKILLAYLSEDEQRERIARIPHLTKLGPNTITSKSALLRELTEVRNSGFAVNNEELTSDLYSIAVPVRNEAREVIAAVNIAAHSSMTSLEEFTTLAHHLVAASDRISARLGYCRDDGKA